MSIIMDRGGQVIRRSRNLRGLLDHAMRTPVVSVEVKETDGRLAEITMEAARTGMDHRDLRRYEYLVQYHNGDVGRDFFADWRIAADFTLNRRSWKGIEISSDIPGFMERIARNAPDY